MRIIINSFKHIRRSGWIGFGSVLVMTLSFFIMSVFGGLAYISNLYIQFFESRNNIIVFFDVGMQPQVIERLREKWEKLPEIKNIEFTSEEEAYQLYSDYASRVLQDIYEVLIEQDEKKLPSSLDIQLESLRDLSSVEKILDADVEEELVRLSVVPSAEETVLDTESTITVAETVLPSDVPLPVEEVAPENELVEPDVITITTGHNSLEERPIEIAVDSESIDTQVEAFSYLRLAGIVVITILFIVIFFLTFMTVEFRLYNQMEEIGVMQLVGGSLTFIRAPYIIEGGFYGSAGALISSIILLGIYYFVFILEVNANLATFLYDSFSALPWPEIGYLQVIALLGSLVLFGFFMGAISSYLSIRRYIR